LLADPDPDPGAGVGGGRCLRLGGRPGPRSPARLICVAGGARAWGWRRAGGAWAGGAWAGGAWAGDWRALTGGRWWRRACGGVERAVASSCAGGVAEPVTGDTSGAGWWRPPCGPAVSTGGLPVPRSGSIGLRPSRRRPMAVPRRPPARPTPTGDWRPAHLWPGIADLRAASSASGPAVRPVARLLIDQWRLAYRACGGLRPWWIRARYEARTGPDLGVVDCRAKSMMGGNACNPSNGYL
jgi:hypothetical protein